ncbi:MAG: hypothetical protein NC344_05700 [Bacteroidales bacterium]|nr:hypothetical protein [Bacteroidales bacterium]MCM1147314.1 hypothetical protein [Bacteroidales bacterium]MCM1206252.1 hypothetical protein [Bacillota bacterium]
MGNTLHLILRHKWYDMIASGEKPEEYREITHHWMSRLFLLGDYRYLWSSFREYPVTQKDIQLMKRQMSETFELRSWAYTNNAFVVFHRAYTSETMTFEAKELIIGKGNPEWGAPEDKEVFIIKLGKRITNI